MRLPEMHRSLLAAALACAASMAFAQRTPVPIVDWPDMPVLSGSNAPNAEVIKGAIIAAGTAGPNKWEMLPTAPDNLRGLFRIRTHMVSVNIAVAADNYSVKYHDSVNMNVKNEGATRLIHPYYNQWVEQLVASIELELVRAGMQPGPRPVRKEATRECRRVPGLPPPPCWR